MLLEESKLKEVQLTCIIKAFAGKSVNPPEGEKYWNDRKQIGVAAYLHIDWLGITSRLHALTFA